MQCRMASGTEASLSRRSKSPSPPQDEQEDKNFIYSCALEVSSILDVNMLVTFVGRYQIPLEFRPCLPESGEWCCSPLFGFGVYASYLSAGLRFPLILSVEASSIDWVLDQTSSTLMDGG